MQRLVGEVQHYDWGSDQAIPEILGEQPNGQPWAEYWLGAHPKAPSVLAGGVTLDQWLADHPRNSGGPAVTPLVIACPSCSRSCRPPMP